MCLLEEDAIKAAANAALGENENFEAVLVVYLEYDGVAEEILGDVLVVSTVDLVNTDSSTSVYIDI